MWKTTDLFLDVWLPADGGGGHTPTVLDRDEFDEAVRRGWIDADTERRALDEVGWILEEHAAGRWPPPATREWTRERARDYAGSSADTTRAEQSRSRSM